MCAIAGIVSVIKPLENDAESIVRNMITAIRHRGPDGEGSASGRHFAFASRRLAIVDMEKGTQPVSDTDKGIFLIQNGEIFNFKSLREDLRGLGYTFETNGDVEVALKLYLSEGMKMPAKLDGQFAIAIWDESKRRLFMIRDRFGICPLFYHYQDNQIAFASEIKALRPALGSKLEVERKGLAQTMTFGTCISPTTIYRDIYSIPPGHFLVLDEKGLVIAPYWDLIFPTALESGALSLRHYSSRLKDQVQRAVREIIPEETSFGTFLSSGIDSTIITSIARQISKSPIPCYSVTSPKRHFDEREGAMRTSRRLGLALHTIDADDNLIARNFPATIRAVETPVSSTESAALYALAARASKDVKVILTGEGADEAFAGYSIFGLKKMSDIFYNSTTPYTRARLSLFSGFVGGSQGYIPDEHWNDKIRHTLGALPAQVIEWQFYRNVIPAIFTRDWVEFLLNEPVEDALDGFRKSVKDRHSLNQSLYIGYKVMLSNYLLGPHGDRVLMAHGIEGRYPFLDRRLVEFAADIHPRFKTPGFVSKPLLRYVASEWVPPHSIPVLKRRFMTSFSSAFINKDTPGLIKYLLSDECLREYRYFDPNKMARMLRAARIVNNKSSAGFAEQLYIGVALSFVVSLQLVHYLFIKENNLQPEINNSNDLCGKN
jgi:asparagine synthase (glutamine-hydrolysing)